MEKDINDMWNEMVGCIKRVAKEVLGESRGKVQPSKEIGGGMMKSKKPLRSEEVV